MTNRQSAAIDSKMRQVIGKAAGSSAQRYTRKGVWTTVYDWHLLTWWPKPAKIGH
ncbi:MAG TPA: hypothetical protein VFQ52_09670 [Rhizomicrobium sp.]|nr:hypothetical protein [Rhizomicrobium sp.]